MLQQETNSKHRSTKYTVLQQTDPVFKSTVKDSSSLKIHTVIGIFLFFKKTNKFQTTHKETNIPAAPSLCTVEVDT